MRWFSRSKAKKTSSSTQPQAPAQAPGPAQGKPKVSFANPPGVYITGPRPPPPPPPITTNGRLQPRHRPDDQTRPHSQSGPATQPRAQVQPRPHSQSGPPPQSRTLNQPLLHQPLPQRPPPPPPPPQHRHAFPYTHQYASQSQSHLQPAGFLPPPPGWNPPAPAPSYQPVIVNQHYYLGSQQHQQHQQHQHAQAPPPIPPTPQPLHSQVTPIPTLSPGPNRPNDGPRAPPPPQPQPSPQHIYHQHHTTLGKFTSSVASLTKDIIPGNTIPQLYDDGLAAWHGAAQLANSSVAMYDEVYNRFNDVMTLIDHEKCQGTENDLFSCHPTLDAEPQYTAPVTQDRGFGLTQVKKASKHKKAQTGNVGSAVVTSAYFSKVELYANSKLPRDLPQIHLYMTTWPLICIAAQYSQRVYDKPTGRELDAHVSGDWLTGTKAMFIKSVPMDEMDTIVFAIRGSATFMDWAVNLNTAPVSPHNFLDDPGNFCHAGFLSVAKKMIKPVAARIRQLLQEDPSRSKYSLLITGHSAGGAVAALLYSHMLAETKEAESELSILSGCFRRIHCVTFGAPPVSLLPLMKPDRANLRKSVFLSFVNEGDPVVRADKSYVKSLVELLTSPPPMIIHRNKDPRGRKNSSDAKGSRSKTKTKSRSRSTSKARKPTWPVPPGTLSNAGRLIILRSGNPKAKVKERKMVQERLNEGVLAVTCEEEQLRNVIWGDPVCHLMSLYAGRVEVLAVGSVTGKH